MAKASYELELDRQLLIARAHPLSSLEATVLEGPGVPVAPWCGQILDAVPLIYLERLARRRNLQRQNPVLAARILAYLECDAISHELMIERQAAQEARRRRPAF